MKFVAFGDILQITQGIIVHGCNAQGVMGSGIALQIKQKYPFAYTSYLDHCKNIISPAARLGTVDFAQVTDELIIANAITQLNYGRDGKRYVNYQTVQTTMHQVAQLADTLGVSVHYPMIGAGLGGGDWGLISDIIDSAFALYPDVHHTLWIYEP